MNQPKPFSLLKFDANGTFDEVTKRVQHAIDDQIGSDPDVWQQLTQQIAAFAILHYVYETKRSEARMTAHFEHEDELEQIRLEYDQALEEGYQESYRMIQDVTDKLHKEQAKVKVLECRVRMLSSNVIAAVTEANSLHEQLEASKNATH